MNTNIKVGFYKEIRPPGGNRLKIMLPENNQEIILNPPYKKTFIRKVIAVAGIFFLANIIWASVSLHAWLYLCAGIAAFYILSYLIKRKK